jgi:hypothetical protein
MRSNNLGIQLVQLMVLGLCLQLLIERGLRIRFLQEVFFVSDSECYFATLSV